MLILSIFYSIPYVVLATHSLLSLPHLVPEQSKGGKGRDSGECGPFPEDKEGRGEGSKGREGAEANLRQPAHLP